MHADDFEIIRIRMKAIARDEGKPAIVVSSPAGKLTQPVARPTISGSLANARAAG